MTLVAHRGFAAVEPENTLGAVRAAAGRADAVEVDVRRCGSGEPVVVHDETVDRVTDATGRVDELDVDALAALSVEGSGEGVPTFEAVVDAAAPPLALVVELKERGLADEVLSACADHPGGVLVQSFDEDALAEARAAAPAVPRSLLFADDPRANLERAVDLGCAAVGAHHALCTPTFVDAAHDRGFDVYGWTVADGATATDLVAAGVDAVVSDVPGVPSP